MSIDIKAIRARLEAAAPGPWTGDRIDGTVKYAVLDANGDDVIRGCNGNRDPSYGIVSDHDATEALILNAPTDLADLCDEVEVWREVGAALGVDGPAAALAEALRLRALLRWREAKVPRG